MSVGSDNSDISSKTKYEKNICFEKFLANDLEVNKIANKSFKRLSLLHFKRYAALVMHKINTHSTWVV